MEGGRQWLSYIIVGAHWTVEAVKCAGADGKGGVECASAFCVDLLPFVSD